MASTGRTRRTSLTVGLEVRLVAVADAGEHLGVAGEPLERPAERPGGGLVAGGQQRGELVAQLLARGARALEHGEQRAVAVVARRSARRAGRRARGRGAGRRAYALCLPRHRLIASSIGIGTCERAADRVAQPRVAAAEDDAQDDLERHRLHALERLDRPAGRPARRAPPRPRAAIVSRQRASASPWNGGSISLRSRRCSSPSSTRIERGPANGSRNAELAPARSSSGGAA